MHVVLLRYTEQPESICAVAALGCYSDVPAIEIMLNQEKIEKVLRRTIESGHHSILEHANFTFAISGVSRALTHQLVRHRIASYSQQSQRYVNMTGFEHIIPETIEKADGGKAVKQYEALVNDIREMYHYLVDTCGVPEEDARMVLPNAACTNIVVTMNCRELLHFFRLRMCNRTQWELREMANIMYTQCFEKAPTIFSYAGPDCWFDGCKESKPCGNPPPKGWEPL